MLQLFSISFATGIVNRKRRQMLLLATADIRMAEKQLIGLARRNLCANTLRESKQRQRFTRFTSCKLNLRAWKTFSEGTFNACSKRLINTSNFWIYWIYYFAANRNLKQSWQSARFGEAYVKFSGTRSCYSGQGAGRNNSP